ncbi:MAG: diol dehydratase small subunit [Chloroflexota bacterium]|nr:diol dehydratase small subunit [Chloroflexota bacterium]
MSDIPCYPLAENDADLKAASGRAYADITFEAAISGELTADDLRIDAETLRKQAQIARAAGNAQMAANLLRAAELTVVPNDELLKMYDLLRPQRASYDTLRALAERLETLYGAVETARFVREAADVYRDRGLLKREV